MLVTLEQRRATKTELQLHMCILLVFVWGSSTSQTSSITGDKGINSYPIACLSVCLLRRKIATRKWLSFKQICNHYFGDIELADKACSHTHGYVNITVLMMGYYRYKYSGLIKQLVCFFLSVFQHVCSSLFFWSWSHVIQNKICYPHLIEHFILFEDNVCKLS